jgi:hypothetical protein
MVGEKINEVEKKSDELDILCSGTKSITNRVSSDFLSWEK